MNDVAANSELVSEVSGFTALASALSYLYIHLLIVVAVALVLSLLSGPSTDGTTSRWRAKLAGLPESFLYCATFALIGTVTAYLIGQGLQGEAARTAQNSSLSSFVPAFISLLGGGVAFLASKTRRAVREDAIVVGVASFLMACVLSYETLKYQQFELIGPDPGDEVVLPDPTTPSADAPKQN